MDTDINAMKVRSRLEFLDIRSSVLTTGLMSAFLTAVTACSTGSDESNSTSVTPQNTLSPISMNTRLATTFSSTQIEGWACLSERGEPLVYTFFNPGTVPGFDSTRLGVQVSDVAILENAQSQYIWQATSHSSVLLDDPVNGIQVTWDNMSFSGAKLLKAFSSTKGQLYCSREIGEIPRQSLENAGDALERYQLGSSRAEVPQACVSRFESNGAIPNTADCRELAITSQAGLGDYFCTGTNGADIVFDYCGLPPFQELNEQGDEEIVECESIEQENLFQTLDAADELIVTNALRPFVPNSTLNAISLVSTGTSAINLIDSAEQAQETGNSSLFFQNLYGLLLPYMTFENSIMDAFETFSNYADGGDGIGCRP